MGEIASLPREKVCKREILHTMLEGLAYVTRVWSRATGGRTQTNIVNLKITFLEPEVYERRVRVRLFGFVKSVIDKVNEMMLNILIGIA